MIYQNGNSKQFQTLKSFKNQKWITFSDIMYSEVAQVKKRVIKMKYQKNILGELGS